MPLLLFLLAMAFSSCVSRMALPPGTIHNLDALRAPSYAETRPTVTVRDELTVVMSGGEVELDFRKSDLAGEAQLFTGIYEGLFSYNPYSNRPVSAAAESWEVSEDKKQWTFTLRKSARFSNGDPVRAQDFRDSWLSLLELGEAAPYSSLFDIIVGAKDYRLGRARDKSKVGISAPDERTLVVKLTSPAAYFRSMLCHHSWSPIHPSLLNETDWDSANIIGNGPFALAENSAEEKTLVKNESYWDASSVDLRRIVLKYEDDVRAATVMWNSGEARWIAGAFDYEALTDRSGVVYNPIFATHYYYICSTRKPLDDYRVRQALILALPWDLLRADYPLPATTLVFPIEGYPDVTADVETDLAKARELLTAAGYPEGKGLPQLVIRIMDGRAAEEIGGLMASAWQELGVPVKIEEIPAGRYFDSLKRGDYDVGSFTWIGDFADPYTFLQMWRRDSNLNYARHNDADYEALLDKSMQQDGEERLETLAKAETLLLERGTVLPIYFSPAVNLVDTEELDGWYPNVLDIHPFKYLSFKEIKPLPGVALLRTP